ncbi:MULTISPECIES: PLP-dependent cysteine synthase family protein [Sphingobacterium]|uniref:PLP-dependent cysteine synthase family protein n=1 Tax=Sphingobacterium TaxID=28453 RepID=UPI0010F3549D|nr:MULTISPECIES: PLP-dependent cysteine synthase family protein [Sphingobacterium]MCW2263094.1 cysteine synthase A [Sphingobacterium kitahiroshimense]TCR11922.1 cysteine synthase A [Sphingobacterium sp. JUb78]
MNNELMFSKCLSPELDSRFKHLWCLVGNTPMLELQYNYKGKAGKIYVKCENYNLTGSIKDRMALYIMYKAYMNCQIQPDDVIIEATSGNTGISFSAIGKALGHQVKIIMPNWLSKERIDIIKSMGADIQLVSKEEGGFLGSIELSEKLARQGGVFLPRQFENQFNAEAHELTTGREIGLQLASQGLVADAFVAGVGTGGTVMGVGRHLRSLNPHVKIHPLEPAESPTMSTGYKVGSHRIQGISDEFIPAIVKLDELDEIVSASDGDSIIMAQKLAKELGLAVGISSGANVIGAIKLKEQLGEEAVVVTLLCDDNKKYLSTDLVREQPAAAGYISTDLSFTGFSPISRLAKSLFTIECV